MQWHISTTEGTNSQSVAPLSWFLAFCTLMLWLASLSPRSCSSASTCLLTHPPKSLISSACRTAPPLPPAPCSGKWRVSYWCNCCFLPACVLVVFGHLFPSLCPQFHRGQIDFDSVRTDTQTHLATRCSKTGTTPPSLLTLPPPSSSSFFLLTLASCSRQ